MHVIEETKLKDVQNVHLMFRIHQTILPPICCMSSNKYLLSVFPMQDKFNASIWKIWQIIWQILNDFQKTIHLKQSCEAGYHQFYIIDEKLKLKEFKCLT